MKGSEKVIGILNDRLAEEITAISQYMVHSEMCKSWGFHKLHEAIEKQAIDEMKHAEDLIGRILYLEGSPTVTKLNRMAFGKTVEEIVKVDLEAEVDAIKVYNESIAAVGEAGDNGTVDLLTKILLDEEAHATWGETQINLMKHLGTQRYMSKQV